MTVISFISTPNEIPLMVPSPCSPPQCCLLAQFCDAVDNGAGRKRLEIVVFVKSDVRHRIIGALSYNTTPWSAAPRVVGRKGAIRRSRKWKGSPRSKGSDQGRAHGPRKIFADILMANCDLLSPLPASLVAPLSFLKFLILQRRLESCSSPTGA